MTGGDLSKGAAIWVAIPAPALRLGTSAEQQLRIRGKVSETLYIGDAVQVTCTVDGVGVLLANVPVEDGVALEVESPVELRANAKDLVVVADPADTNSD